MEKLVRTDPIGAFHGLIKYNKDDPEAQEAVKFCQLVDAKRFCYEQGRPRKSWRTVPAYGTTARPTCSFCKKRGHHIKVCRFLARAKCTRCKALGHRASHCCEPLVAELAKCCVWRPSLYLSAFQHAIMSQDIVWVDELLEHDFTITFEVVVQIQDRDFRNDILKRLLGWWLDEDGKTAFMRYLHYLLENCLKSLARRERDPKKRQFFPESRLAIRAADLRYLYTMGLLYGAECVPKHVAKQEGELIKVTPFCLMECYKSSPNFSYLKVMHKRCRRHAMDQMLRLEFLSSLPFDLIQLISNFLYF